MHEENQNKQDLSAKLTAYVLGELDLMETQAMEQALAESAELRSEKAKIEAVIGLVREHGAEEVGLSDEARAALISKAPEGKVLPFLERQLSPQMASAATGLLLVGAAGAVYVMGRTNSTVESEVMDLARAEANDRLRASVDSQAPQGEGGAYKGPLDQPAQVSEKAPDARLAEELKRGVDKAKAAAISAGTAAAPPQTLNSLAAPSTAQSAPPPKGGGGGGGPSAAGGAGPSSPGPVGSTVVIGIGGGAGGASAGKFGGRLGKRSRAPQSSTRRQAVGSGNMWFESATGSEDFFLGQAAGEPVIMDAEVDREALSFDGAITGGLIEELEDEARSKERAQELQRQQAELRSQRIIDHCKPFADEDPAAMFFRFWGDNPFVQASLDAQSTFGVDVDTASYTLARRYLADGNLPGKAQVRTEEFLNYFKPDVDAPTDGVFNVHTEIAPSRFGGPEGKWMLRVTVRGKDVAREERQPLNLTFVVDVSGSMNQGGRLETVKHGLRLLTSQLDANDSVALVAYSTEARVVLPMTSAASRALIEEAIHGLTPGGGTNAEAGLKMGYAAAADQVSDGRHHRVVLLSDGVANIGQTDQDRINADIQKYRDRGIYLNTIGVGMDNHNDAFLEQLANKGDGICNYIDDDKEARRALVENFTGAFEAIARDVKIQVEFESSIVKRYRQIGYENRAIADADFRNDAVDAGEVGAGHQVTALYELELEPNAELVKGALAQVRLRWKEPTGAERDPAEDSATERQWATTLNSAVSMEGASYGFRRAVCVAQFAELLRRSEHARTDSLDDLIAEAQRLEREHLVGTPGADDDFIEFIAMMERSKAIILDKINSERTPLGDCVRDLRDRRYRHHSCVKLPGKAAEAQALEVEIAGLEAKVRELVQEQPR